MEDVLKIGGRELRNRLFVGTGKYKSYKQMGGALRASQSEVVTVALRRVDLNAKGENIFDEIPDHMLIMPNTSGAKTAEEAVRIARLAKEAGISNWIKIEVIPDEKYLFPDNEETIKATEILAKEGFVVLPYMTPDLIAAKKMKDAGAAAIMPLGAPIGSNKGIRVKEIIQIMIEEIDLPIIVDAGIGKPSEAAEAMEMGADAVLVNTAIAKAENPIEMAKAFNLAVKAGRIGFLSGFAPVSQKAHASSPLKGVLD